MKVAIALISLILFFEDNPDPLRFQDEINSYKQADKTDPPPDGCFLFIGSSSMRMWKSLQEDFKDYPVINRGFGGSHFSDAIYYFEDLVLAYNPEKIVIYEGDNDLAGNKSPNTIMKDLNELLELIRDNLGHPDIAIISAKPSPRRWDIKDKYEKLNAKFKKDLVVRQHETHELIKAGGLKAPGIIMWGFNDPAATFDRVGLPTVRLSRR